MTQTTDSDVLVIGSGAAGLRLALELADHCRVTVLAKGPITEGSSLYAQGGVSAVLDPEDSIDSHVADTLDAGAGLCHPDAVRFTVERGPDAVHWLIDHGVPFTREHAAMASAMASTSISPARAATVTAASSMPPTPPARPSRPRWSPARARIPTSRCSNSHIAVDLITSAKLGLSGPNRCVGAYVLDRGHGDVDLFRARFVVLATGGASKVYLYTSNPDIASGDGIAMAWRAGCRIANMEFNQFHPTCLYHPHAKSFLITEAVRGEGGAAETARTANASCTSFDARAELAPRDIVARAIDHEMKRLGAECVYLDISHKPADVHPGTLPDHLRALPGIRYRHDQAADPGGAGRALHLRRRDDRSARPHRHRRSLCHRRDRLHRPARRQPHGQQFAAGMSGVRQARRRRTSSPN